MTLRRLPLSLIILVLASSPVAHARQWFDVYREGIDAARRQQWSVVIAKMNEAVALKPQEEERARTYGAIFIKYRPYYYRGVAHLSLGNTAEGVSDLERTGGPGELNLGGVETLLVQARQTLAAQQAAQREPDPAPPTPAPTQPSTTPPVQTPPTQQPAQRPAPSVPAVDPALGAARTRAEGLLSRANRTLQEARRAQAPSLAADQYSSGERLLLQASSAQSSADSTAEWNRVAELADRAQRTLSSSVTAATVASNASRTLPSQTTDEVLADTRSRLRDALESYFGGRFSEAARALESLSRDSGRNYPMVWAFLGAAHYYEYYLEGERDASKREAAVAAFRRARSLDPSLELSSRYFSSRVQRFYEATLN